MLAGISTRKYPLALEPVGEAVERQATSTSKLAVSRRFVTATAERLAELCARPVDETRWPIVMLDGVHLGEHLLAVALGVTDDGTKVPLGVVEGSTEHAAACGRLVADLVDRGLDAERGILFVIDGGKALSKAIRAAFGDQALIHRCRRHKERNVIGYLPEAERPLIERKLRAAWANPDADAAQRELEALARALDTKRPGAAASLREGLAHTLTVNRRGVAHPECALQRLRAHPVLARGDQPGRGHPRRQRGLGRIQDRPRKRTPGAPGSAGAVGPDRSPTLRR